LGAFVLIFLLSLVGSVSIIVIGYYLPDTSAKAYWFISRSSGVVAYLLITLGVLWGLVQSGNLFRPRVSPLLSLGLHSFFNWLGLGLAVLHGMILTGDRYIEIDLTRGFVPFLSSYRPIPVGLGIIALYLMFLLSLSFYARTHLGQKNFRSLHYASFLVFLLVTAHSLLAGTDSPALWWLYVSSLAAVGLLTVARIVHTRRAGHRPLPRSRPPVGPRRPQGKPGARVAPLGRR